MPYLPLYCPLNCKKADKCPYSKKPEGPYCEMKNPDCFEKK